MANMHDNVPPSVEFLSECEFVERRLNDAANSTRLEAAQCRCLCAHVANALSTVENPNFLRRTLVRTTGGNRQTQDNQPDRSRVTGTRCGGRECCVGRTLGTPYRSAGAQRSASPTR